MNVTFRPLVTWPRRPTRTRVKAVFTATYGKTLTLLEKELWQLSAASVVIQLALGEGDLRRDGMPKATARPTHPGVVISFNSRHGPLSFACDRFLKWEDNLRAIALTLERLRLADLYGVTQSGEQYRGFPALAETAGHADPRRAAAAELVRYARTAYTVEEVLRDAATRGKVVRDARRQTHPDAGGSAESFRQVQAAVTLLEHEFAVE